MFTHIYVYIYILVLAYASYKTGRHFPTQRCLRQDRSVVRGVWGYQCIEVSSKAYSIRYCPIAIRGVVYVDCYRWVASCCCWSPGAYLLRYGTVRYSMYGTVRYGSNVHSMLQ